MVRDIQFSSRKIIKPALIQSIWQILTGTDECWALEIEQSLPHILPCWRYNGRDRQQTTNKYVHGDKCYEEIQNRARKIQSSVLLSLFWFCYFTKVDGVRSLWLGDIWRLSWRKGKKEHVQRPWGKSVLGVYEKGLLGSQRNKAKGMTHEK